MKFEMKNSSHGYWLFKKEDHHLILLGNMTLFKKQRKNESYCSQHDKYFDYHGITNSLCGKQQNDYGHMIFSPKRILVIQMK